ncbi:MAG: AmmeMemoRadiSam system protein B [Acidobacteriota bacterium]
MSTDRGAHGGPLRPSPIAGTWYPAQPEELARSVRALLDAAEPVQLDGELVALVSPHAGLRYSGPVAAAGYQLLGQFRFESVIIIGPSHHAYFQGASIFARGAFETPLGHAAVDEELAEAIQSRDRRLCFFAEAHDREHCLEMQLPFLQVLAPGVSMVPIVMGDQRRENVEAISRAVAEAVAASGESVLLVASSDLSHYKSAETAARMDGRVADCLERFAPEELMSLLEENHEHACGGGPIVAVLMAARTLGAGKARVLRYADSGDITGDKSEVVGYLSAAIAR